MKQLILLFAIVAIAYATSAHAQWMVNSSGTTDAIYGGAFSDASTVFLTGWNADGASILKSTDAGATWSEAWHNDGSYSIFGVTFPTPDHGYVAGYDPDCDCALMLRTADSGNTWTSSTFTNSYGFYKVVAPDASTLLACGYDGVIMRSTNGGKFWSAAKTGTNTLVFRVMNFGDAQTGYAVGGDTFNVLDKIYKTTDGGANWSLLQNYAGTRSIGEIAFLNATTGFYAGSDGTDCIYGTTDGGATWTRVYAGTDKSVFTGLAFKDSKTAYAANAAGRIVRSNDGGMHWSTAFQDAGEQVNALAIGQGGAVVAGTLNGDVLHDNSAASVAIAAARTGFARIIAGRILRLEGEAATATSVVVHDMLGRAVINGSVAGSGELSLASLPSGAYFWSAYQGQSLAAHGKVMID